MLSDDGFKTNLDNVVNRQREDRADTGLIVEKAPWREASWYGVVSPAITMRSPEYSNS
jgi:glucose-1-phosphate thymidylyltransferase